MIKLENLHHAYLLRRVLLVAIYLGRAIRTMGNAQDHDRQRTSECECVQACRMGSTLIPRRSGDFQKAEKALRNEGRIIMINR